jgi:hypothetical protein
MAVLGGLEHNKDPRKLLRFSTYSQKIGNYQENSLYYSHQGTFWTRKIWEGASTSSSYSADTVKQIYSVSGSSGFFWGAISPVQASAASYVTWTIVVDGVSYSIQQGNNTKSESDSRFILGNFFKEADLNQTSAGTDNYTWDTNRGSFSLNGAANSTLLIMRFPPTTSNDSDSTVFFANSLTVSCTPTQANTNNGEKNSGVLVRLID